MTIRTIDHSDQWNDFRTNDPSDYRPVGLLTIRTSARFSDQWTVGPTTIRNIELSPGRRCMVSLLQWRHNGRHGVSNHQPHDCLLNCFSRHTSKKPSKLRVSGICEGNSPVTGEFPAQMTSNEETVSIGWRHHVVRSWPGPERWAIDAKALDAAVPRAIFNVSYFQ